MLPCALGPTYLGFSGILAGGIYGGGGAWRSVGSVQTAPGLAEFAEIQLVQAAEPILLFAGVAAATGCCLGHWRRRKVMAANAATAAISSFLMSFTFRQACKRCRWQ